MFKETVVLSLGGSLIVPNGGVDIPFLTEFNKFVRKYVSRGWRIFMVCGGGKTSRHYIDGAVGVLGHKITSEDRDWLGIHGTRINAHLLRTIFQDIAYPRIIDRYDRKYDVGEYPVVIGAGWKPGWSTDYDSVVLAKQHGARFILNLSNIDMVYTKDPNKHKDAHPIERTNWDFFQTLVGDKWSPGLSGPFDPIASKEAKKNNLTVIVLRGDNFSNLEKVFKGEKFKGTVIGPATFDVGFFDREYFEGKKGGYRGYRERRVKYVLYKIVNMFRALAIKLSFSPKKVLDVGCGFGLMVKYLRMMGVEAYGIDVSNYALSRADRGAKEYLKKARVDELPFADNSFDLVVTYDVLEHISEIQLAQAVKESMRVSSKYCLHKIFTTENGWIKIFHGLDISHVSVFDKKWWEKFFVKNKYRFSKKFFLHLPSFMETMFLLEK